jgi:twitching motility protein PilU
MNINPYLKLMLSHQAEKLTIQENVVPFLTKGETKTNIGKNLVSKEDVTSIFDLLTNDSQKMSFSFDDSVRFMVKLYEGNDFVFVAQKDGDELTVHFLVDQRSKKNREPSIPDMAKLQVMGDAPADNQLSAIPYLMKMVQLGGSDIFFSVDSEIKMKLNGRVLPLDNFLLTQELMLSLAKSIMPQSRLSEFLKTHDLDMAITLPDGSARFRVNAFYQRGHISLVLRLIPSEIPKASDLNLPEVLTELIMKKRGLILVVGGTGSGKSTTMAAMINHRNENSEGHILTIEDPVEFSHPNLKSIVNQREIGTDTLSFETALKASLREAPDVILIGEIRNKETMESALELANTGHLCLATMHSNNANQALDRVINMFEQEQHKQLFMDLSANLSAVVSQRLIPNKQNGRSAAIEILINTPHVSNLILKGSFDEIKEAMESDKNGGTRTFDKALLELYRNDLITKEEAISNADSQNDLETKINFN